MKKNKFVYKLKFILALIMVFLLLNSNTRIPRVRVISFSGYNWTVKDSQNMKVGPGPNYFSRGPRNVSMDENGSLILAISGRARLYCAEVICNESLGYGEYFLQTVFNPNELNENVVLGFFTWDDDNIMNHREIDIEYSKWGNKYNNNNSQFVIQPYNKKGNRYRFNVDTANYNSDRLLHYFKWTEDKITFKVAKCNSEDILINIDKIDENIIKKWEYTGKDIPKKGNENIRINLWLYNNPTSITTDDLTEIIVEKFKFVPLK